MSSMIPHPLPDSPEECYLRGVIDGFERGQRNILLALNSDYKTLAANLAREEAARLAGQKPKTVFDMTPREFEAWKQSGFSPAFRLDPEPISVSEELDRR